MKNKIIVKRSKLNYISLFIAALMIYLTYDAFSSGNSPKGIIFSVIVTLSLVHNILLMTTPLIVHANDSLILKPKIPFEKKILLVDELKEVKANSESELILIMENKTKIKLDMGGFKKKEIEEAKAYLLNLI